MKPIKQKINSRVIRGLVTFEEEFVRKASNEDLAKHLRFELSALQHDLLIEFARVRGEK